MFNGLLDTYEIPKMVCFSGNAFSSLSPHSDGSSPLLSFSGGEYTQCCGRPRNDVSNHHLPILPLLSYKVGIVFLTLTHRRGRETVSKKFDVLKQQILTKWAPSGKAKKGRSLVSSSSLFRAFVRESGYDHSTVGPTR